MGVRILYYGGVLKLIKILNIADFLRIFKLGTINWQIIYHAYIYEGIFVGPGTHMNFFDVALIFVKKHQFFKNAS